MIMPLALRDRPAVLATGAISNVEETMKDTNFSPQRDDNILLGTNAGSIGSPS